MDIGPMHELVIGMDVQQAQINGCAIIVKGLPVASVN